MNKKPITVYWANDYDLIDDSSRDDLDWTLLFPLPKTLLHMVGENSSSSNSSYLACPAFYNKYKKVYVFSVGMDASYRYDYTEGKMEFEATSYRWIPFDNRHKPTMNSLPLVNLATGWFFFADEPLDAYFTPPIFHKPEYFKYGTIMPGEYNIGNWFRRYNSEFQMWDNKGIFEIKENEPLFYVEFKTDRPIILKRFNMNKQLDKIARGDVFSSNLFGKGQTLLSRYIKFNNSGLRDKILKEIKNNLID